MKGKFCFLLALSLMIMRWVSATSRLPLAPNNDLAITHSSSSSSPSLSASMVSKLAPKQDMKSSSSSSSKEKRAEKVIKENEEELYSRGMSKIGSSPPSCEHKCYGCTPCEAIQVQTTTSRSSRVRVQYTNYEPEGWKCKCGPFFYSP